MTIKSMLAATLAAATMLTTVGTALAAPGVTLGAVNFREEPGGDIMYSLPKGKFVDIDSCDGGWCEIEVNGDEGYVSAKYLALIEDEYDDDYDDDDDYDHHHHSSPDVEICLGGGGFGGGGFGYGSICID